MYLGGDTDAGIVSLGPAGGFADAIESAGKIVERLVEGACAAWEVMTGRVERAWA